MRKKGQAVDNGSLTDHISRGCTSTVNDNKTSAENSRKNGGVSTEAFIRSDMSPETAQAVVKEKRKHPTESATKEINHVPHPHKQLKPDSSSETKVVHGSECSKLTKSDQIFDLNEGTETNEPIPVVAKLGVLKGLPKKPLSFGGELGWNRSGINSAFREKTPVSKGFDFDLNIAATMDPEVACNSDFDLNNDPNPNPRAETRQLLPDRDVPPTGARGPCWVDLSSVRGFGNAGFRRPSPPTTEQVQMVVPMQLPYSTAPGLYIGKMNGFGPGFYPHNVLPPLYNHPGVRVPYPGNVRLLEMSQGLSLNPRAYSNMRHTVFSNGGTTLMENGSRTSMNRRESDANWSASQITQSLL